MVATEKSGLGSRVANWVRAHTHELEDLPEPGQEWMAREVGFGSPMITQLKTKGIIKKVEKRDNRRWVYRTDKHAYEGVVFFLKQARQSDHFLPCGHDGFRNEGDVIECKRCGETHTKAEVEA